MANPAMEVEKSWAKRELGDMGRNNPGFGGGGVCAEYITADGSNKDLFVRARKSGVAGNSYNIKWESLGTPAGGFNDPGRSYLGGEPARLIVSSGSGTDFVLIAKDPGTAGDLISITLVDPGGASKALAVSVSGKDISVSLATDSSASLTTTADLLIAAVKASVAAGALVDIYITETSSGPLDAVAKTSLTGGTDDPTLTYVRLSCGATGSVNTTALQLVDFLKNSLLDAGVKKLTTGAGTVNALAARTALNGTTSGADSHGNLSQLSLAEDREEVVTGVGGNLGRTNKKIEVLSDRKGVSVGTRQVTAQEKLIVAASAHGVNLATERRHKSPFL